MRRYIDADKLQKDGWKLRREKQGLLTSTYETMELDCASTADVRENVKGEWLNMERIEDDKAEYITEWQQAQCSVCHKWHTTPYMFFIKKNERHYKFTHYNFCPNCGADMRDGEADDESRIN